MTAYLEIFNPLRELVNVSDDAHLAALSAALDAFSVSGYYFRMKQPAFTLPDMKNLDARRGQSTEKIANLYIKSFDVQSVIKARDLLLLAAAYPLMITLTQDVASNVRLVASFGEKKGVVLTLDKAATSSKGDNDAFANLVLHYLAACQCMAYSDYAIRTAGSLIGAGAPEAGMPRIIERDAVDLKTLAQSIDDLCDMHDVKIVSRSSELSEDNQNHLSLVSFMLELEKLYVLHVNGKQTSDEAYMAALNRIAGLYALHQEESHCSNLIAVEAYVPPVDMPQAQPIEDAERMAEPAAPATA